MSDPRQNPSYIPKVSVRVSIKFDDGTEEQFGFASEDSANQFYKRSLNRHDVTEAKIIGNGK